MSDHQHVNTLEYFYQACCEFRQAAGSTESKLEDLDAMFLGLGVLAMRCKTNGEEEEAKLRSAFDAVQIDWMMRREMYFAPRELGLLPARAPVSPTAKQ